jgi:hypothetical protein
MSRGAMSQFHNVSTCSGKNIEYWIKFLLKNSVKLKLKTIEEFGCVIDIVGNLPPPPSRI